MMRIWNQSIVIKFETCVMGGGGKAGDVDKYWCHYKGATYMMHTQEGWHIADPILRWARPRKWLGRAMAMKSSWRDLLGRIFGSCHVTKSSYCMRFSKGELSFDIKEHTRYDHRKTNCSRMDPCTPRRPSPNGIMGRGRRQNALGRANQQKTREDVDNHDGWC